MPLSHNEIIEQAKKIKLIISDVDGVLTDGRIIYDNFGDELKCFDAHDGMGIKLAQQADIKCVLLTARKSKVVQIRAKELGVDGLFVSSEKGAMFDRIVRRMRFSADEVCYIGDDLFDLAPVLKAGLGVAVANATAVVKERADYCTAHAGGRGAVREVVELLLQARNIWGETIERYAG